MGKRNLEYYEIKKLRVLRKIGEMNRIESNAERLRRLVGELNIPGAVGDEAAWVIDQLEAGVPPEKVFASVEEGMKREVEHLVSIVWRPPEEGEVK